MAPRESQEDDEDAWDRKDGLKKKIMKILHNYGTAFCAMIYYKVIWWPEKTKQLLLFWPRLLSSLGHGLLPNGSTMQYTTWQVTAVMLIPAVRLQCALVLQTAPATKWIPAAQTLPLRLELRGEQKKRGYLPAKADLAAVGCLDSAESPRS